jgi:hypothetical protein
MCTRLPQTAAFLGTGVEPDAILLPVSGRRRRFPEPDAAGSGRAGGSGPSVAALGALRRLPLVGAGRAHVNRTPVVTCGIDVTGPRPFRAHPGPRMASKAANRRLLDAPRVGPDCVLANPARSGSRARPRWTGLAGDGDPLEPCRGQESLGLDVLAGGYVRWSATSRPSRGCVSQPARSRILLSPGTGPVRCLHRACRRPAVYELRHRSSCPRRRDHGMLIRQPRRDRSNPGRSRPGSRAEPGSRELLGVHDFRWIEEGHQRDAVGHPPLAVPALEPVHVPAGRGIGRCRPGAGRAARSRSRCARCRRPARCTSGRVHAGCARSAHGGPASPQAM